MDYQKEQIEDWYKRRIRDVSYIYGTEGKIIFCDMVSYMLREAGIDATFFDNEIKRLNDARKT